MWLLQFLVLVIFVASFDAVVVNIRELKVLLFLTTTTPGSLPGDVAYLDRHL